MITIQVFGEEVEEEVKPAEIKKEVINNPEIFYPEPQLQIIDIGSHKRSRRNKIK